jgi:hypothetical protein
MGIAGRFPAILIIVVMLLEVAAAAPAACEVPPTAGDVPLRVRPEADTVLVGPESVCVSPEIDTAMDVEVSAGCVTALRISMVDASPATVKTIVGVEIVVLGLCGVLPELDAEFVVDVGDSTGGSTFDLAECFINRAI